jgi:uncharacterized protein (DUF736 family)
MTWNGPRPCETIAPGLISPIGVADLLAAGFAFQISPALRSSAGAAASGSQARLCAVPSVRPSPGNGSGEQPRRSEMPAIGYVQRQSDGSFKGSIRTLSVNTEVTIVPNREKRGEQPDYRVMASGVELGGGWIRTGEVSQREYVRLAMSAPELGPRTLYANLGRAAGQDDDDTYAIIWNAGE